MADEMVKVNTKEIAALIRAIRQAEPDLAKHLRDRLRALGAIVADEAKSRVGEYSRSVPDSIKVRVSGMTVSVVAGGAGVPMGGLLELGNAKSTNQETFTHPVFGHRAVWVKQPMHPFLAPALASKVTDVDAAATAAIDDTIAELVS